MKSKMNTQRDGGEEKLLSFAAKYLWTAVCNHFLLKFDLHVNYTDVALDEEVKSCPARVLMRFFFFF